VSLSETVFMFSGQGSQYFQMGRPLYDEDRIFREWMVRLDEVVRQASGRSVIETLYSDLNRKGDPFDRTLLTHPAIFMVEYSLAQSLIHSGIQPDLVLGVSLGSFAAAAVADFIGVEDALTAVVRQAIALEEGCESGGMTAVMADPALFENDFLCAHSELAAINFSSHFVVSARTEALAEIEATLKMQNTGFQRLPVRFSFHSRSIDPAKGPFQAFMRTIRRRAGRVPLICCDQAAVFSDLPDEYFWNVVRRPIRFRETVALLERQGARRYIDVGPAGTLATFMKYGMPRDGKSTAHGILSPFGLDRKNLAALAVPVTT
jgi:bacillaene synthase trans-acting acyltransferase